MAVSDQLTKVALRAKQAELRTAAATAKAAAELVDEVEIARESALLEAEHLRARADMQSDAIGTWWTETQRAWSKHVAQSHHLNDSKYRIIDLRLAQRTAHDAEVNAAFAIDYACAALEEAEYAVLEATLARARADEMARPRSLR